jgi:hypothetical protein
MRRTVRLLKFVIFKDKAGKHRWRMVAGNGQPLASSEAYAAKAGARNAIAAVKKGASGALVDDRT